MKKIYKLLLILVLPISLYSHSLLLNLIDNEDGTMTIVGGFNTGESAAGALIKLETLSSEEILFQQRLSDSSELTVDIPNIPYQVILDGGPGHTVSKEGIEPEEGFIKPKKEQAKKKERPSRANAQISSSKAVTISILIAFILLFATIIISVINTNKLMKELQSKSR